MTTFANSLGMLPKMYINIEDDFVETSARFLVDTLQAKILDLER